MRFILLFAALLLLMIRPVSAQQQGERIPGEVMIQLKYGQNISEFIPWLDQQGLAVKLELSKRLRIYLLEFEESRHNVSALIGNLQKQPAVSLAQANHVVALRESEENFPDDPFFENQWGFYNDGSGGGVEGADIDAVRAWDHTTGGLTVLGDTIVVAVIDGGAYLQHEDLNFFKNHHEIPDNNIDDDNNGYVDDYDGWNAYNNSGSVPTSSHGTHVAGTVGAIGNNDMGVTGVNWNVKVMPIAGSSSIESTVVNAYSYVYEMRARYNETQGDSGAFIVATNASFGVDYGNPDNYPIWGAMYDSLGAIGVLNAGATANRSVNVDEQGDIPTAFESPWLITVTNTTNRDEKYSSAGYGLESIDLGAPGTSVYSTRPAPTNYGYGTGTSTATPHVAGAVGLLFAAADTAFMEAYFANPAEYALLIKEYILNGTDPLEDLDGITVTGGRLNIYTAINLLLGNISMNTIPVDTLVITAEQESIKTDSIQFINTGLFDLQLIFEQEDTAWLSLQSDTLQLPVDTSASLLLSVNTADMQPDTLFAKIQMDAGPLGQHTFVVKLVVLEPVGINSLAMAEAKVFPNPFADQINFSLFLPSAEKLCLQITNLSGRLVYAENRQAGAGSQKLSWNGTGLNGSKVSDGLYFYQIQIGNQLINGKLIKQ
jgi:hypothetical protein